MSKYDDGNASADIISVTLLVLFFFQLWSSLPIVEGKRPATASPVMIAGAYSVRPNPAAKAKAAF